MQRKLAIWGLLILILHVIGGCATLAQRTPEEIVRERVNERWSALIEGQLETAYNFETQEYRELYTFIEYRNKIRGVGAWQKIEVVSVECEEKKCVAVVRIYVRMPIGLGFDNVGTSGQVNENWLLQSTTGRWNHVSDQ